jgi:hypothetical protein
MSKSTMQALAETFGDDELRALGLSESGEVTSSFPADQLIEASLTVLDRMSATHIGGIGPVEEAKAKAEADVEEGDCAACADGRPEDCERNEDELGEANPYHHSGDNGPPYYRKDGKIVKNPKGGGQFASASDATLKSAGGSGSYQFSAPNNTRFNKPRIMDGAWKKTDARRGQKKGNAKWTKRSKNPCGRAARAKGAGARCQDGKASPGGLNKNFREDVEVDGYRFAKPESSALTELRDLLDK